VFLHVDSSYPIRNPLKAERREKPIENRRRIAGRDSSIQAPVTNFFVDLIKE
jgi:hypothetical protein